MLPSLNNSDDATKTFLASLPKTAAQTPLIEAPLTPEERRRQRFEELEKHLFTHSELLDLPLPPIEWLIPNFLPNPGVVAIAAPPASLKTYFAYWLALRLAQGKKLFAEDHYLQADMRNQVPEPTPVLFVEAEMPPEEMIHRGRDVFGNHNRPELFHHLVTSISLRTPDDIEFLKATCLRLKIRVLFLDPFSTVSGLEDENSNAEAAKVMDTIRKEFVHNPELRLTVVFLHHPAKGHKGDSISLRGAGDILGKCDMAYVFKLDKEKENEIVIEYAKNRSLPPRLARPFRVAFEETQYTSPTSLSAPVTISHFVYKGEESPQAKTPDKNATVKQMILTLLTGKTLGATREEMKSLITSSIEKSSGAFRAVWKELRDTGDIIQVGTHFYHKDSAPNE